MLGGGCRVLSADLLPLGGADAKLCAACAGRFEGTCWRGWPSAVKHLHGLVRRNVTTASLSAALQKLRSAPLYVACLTRSACNAASRGTRLTVLWQRLLQEAGVASAPLRSQLPAPPAPTARVGLVVRTYAGAFVALSTLLHSVELFWPHHRWPVTVVLDADSQEDRDKAAAGLPPWVRVDFEEPPPLMERWAGLQRAGSRTHGWQRASWSHFHLDRYTDAEFIANMDSDTIFHTWVDDELLFDADGRPHVVGITHYADFGPVLRALGLPTEIDFMAAQPMVVRRRHFQDVRHFVVQRMSRDTAAGTGSTFDEAFALLTHEVLRNETLGTPPRSRHVISQQSVMGAYLWQARRPQYAWHILWRYPTPHSGQGWPLAPPPLASQRCPPVFVGSHLNCWGESGRCVPLKLATAGTQQVGQHYALKSAEVLLAAICACRAVAAADGSGSLGDWWARWAASRRNFPALGQALVPGRDALEQCDDLASALPPAQLLFGISNIVFWPDEFAGVRCLSQADLFERWGHHALRSLRSFHESRVQ